MPVDYKNLPNNPWFFKVYIGSAVPIPIRIMAGPNTPSDITGYSFSVRGKISFDQEDASFTISNDHFTIIDATKGLASFTMPSEILDALPPADYLCQVTITADSTVTKSQIFTLKVLQSI